MKFSLPRAIIKNMQPNYFQQKTITIQNLTCAYRYEGDGPVLILLHGWAQSSATWDNVAPILQKEYAIYALDLPGFGQSEAPSRAWTIEEYADFVQAFVRSLSLTPHAVIGHSFGARIAASYAVKYKTRRLILCAMADSAAFSPFRFINILLIRLLRRVMPLALYRGHRYLFTPSGFADVSALGAKRAKTMLDIYLAAHQCEDIKNLSAISCPTLLIYGKRDPIANAKTGSRLNSCIARSILISLPDAWHFPHLKNAGAFLESVLPFLRN